jgi:hypothetical protein
VVVVVGLTESEAPVPTSPEVAHEPANQYVVPEAPDAVKVVDSPSQMVAAEAFTPVGFDGGARQDTEASNPGYVTDPSEVNLKVSDPSEADEIIFEGKEVNGDPGT